MKKHDVKGFVFAVTLFCSVLSSPLVLAAEEPARAERMAQAMQARFVQADGNADAQLTPEEAEGKMPYVARNFALIDADKSGTVSKDEIRQHAAGMRPAPGGAVQ